MFERCLGSVLAGHGRSVLLLGPRQVGKSTLLTALDPDLSINLALPSSFRDYIRDPARLERELAAAPANVRTVMLDEVQRVPELLDVVQAEIDRRPRRFRFLLSGSSARKLRRGRANLLPGRVIVHRLDPLLATELGARFDLERALVEGTLPGIWAEEETATRHAVLRSYVDSYLREEIQAEALVRDLGGFSRLLDLVAACSGRIVNLQALSKDAAISYETARRYLEVLEDTLVLERVPAWSGSDRASFIVHPKWLLFDLGVRNALLNRPLDRLLPDERGLLLEHFVGLELLRRTRDLWPDTRLLHFRSRQGAEVDFVVERGRDLWGVEVKASARLDPSAARGLHAFEAAAGRPVRKIVVFLGGRAQSLGRGVEALPLGRFLEQLPAWPGGRGKPL